MTDIGDALLTIFKFFTFDLIGDLAFGESFGSLESFSYHPWIDFIISLNSTRCWKQASTYFGPLESLFSRLIPRSMIKRREAHMKLTAQMATHRWELKRERPDLVSRMIAEDSGISLPRFTANSSTLAIAGSETTATVLSGVTYHLIKNPAILRKVTDEVRSAFTSEDDMNMNTVSALKYMLACLDEAMRVYPGVSGNLPRRTDKDEAMDFGFVPANVSQPFLTFSSLSLFCYTLSSPLDRSQARMFQGSSY